MSAGVGRLKKVKITFRRVGLGFLLALIGGVTFCTYNFASAEKRVRGLCAQIQPGMSLQELQAFASNHGLVPQPHEGLSYIVEARTNGRWGCKVIIEQGVVKASEYNFAD